MTDGNSFSEERLGDLLEELYHVEDLYKDLLSYATVKINLILDEIENEIEKGDIDGDVETKT